MPPSVLVTRPAEDAGRWASLLQAQGVAAEALPLIDIAPVLDAAALTTLWQTLPRYGALMFVSGNAVAHFFAGHSRPWPLALRCLAPGPGTAHALRQQGVPDGLIDVPPADATQFDSETLWTVIGARSWQGQCVLIVRGQGRGDEAAGASSGREWMSARLKQAGASVDQVAVYRRAAPAFSQAQLQRLAAAQTDGSVWLLSSSEALQNLPPGLHLGLARALATHPRIALAARQAGFGQVAQSRPTVADVVASIKSLNT